MEQRRHHRRYALIVDIYPGITGSYPGFYSGFYQFNNHLYFNANDGTHGVELWVTDGTAGGTSLVADIAPGPGNSYAGYIQYGVANFVTINNKMLFQATDGVNGYQLWTSDGTTGGTVIVANVFHGGSAPGNYGGFIAYNGKAYYDATDSTHGYELWSSDRTASGTNLVKDAYPGTNSGYPSFLPCLIINCITMAPIQWATTSCGAAMALPPVPMQLPILVTPALPMPLTHTR